MIRVTGGRGARGARALAACTFLVAVGGACSKEESGGPASAAARGPMKYPVEVVDVQSGSVEYSVQAVGSVEAFERVAVTARVPGVVEKIGFQEGDMVGPEKVLAEIDPERYRLALESAKAEFVGAEAAKEEARLGLERRRAVNEKNPDLVRAEEVDQWRTRLAGAEAEAARMKAAVGLAQLNLRGALVKAPAAGVIQTREIETGRYVQPGEMIATLVRRDPLLLRFRVPELEAAPLDAGMRARFTLRGQHDKSYNATLTLVSAAADPRDRMVEVTAKVDDPLQGDLRPGAFAEVTVAVGSPSNSPVIPQTAIRPSDRGFLAYVVEGEVARERVLELGLRTADGRVEVRSGLEPGDRLVVRGAEALSDGALVAEKSAQGAPEPARGAAP